MKQECPINWTSIYETEVLVVGHNGQSKMVDLRGMGGFLMNEANTSDGNGNGNYGSNNDVFDTTNGDGNDGGSGNGNGGNGNSSNGIGGTSNPNGDDES